MFTLAHAFILLLLIVVILLILILTIILKNKKLLKKELIIIIPIMIFVIFYFFNINFYYFVRSNIFPDRVCNIEKVCTSGPSLEETEYKIKLPAGSILLFKCPEKVYYNKSNPAQCKDSFNMILSEEKKKNLISDYTYDNSKKIFFININSKEKFQIDIMENADCRRYSISPISNR